jgi:hypothetical protein
MKKVFALLFIVGLFTFVACGGKKEETTEVTNEQTTADTTTVSTDTVTTDTTAADTTKK